MIYAMTTVLVLILLALLLVALVGLARALVRDGLGSRPAPRSRVDWTDSLPEWQHR